MRKKIAWISAALLVCGAVFYQTACTREYIVAADSVCFERDVLPIFVSNCTQSGCHDPFTREKGYDLSNYDGILRGVSPGNFRSSAVYNVLVKLGGETAMPPKPYSRLTDAQMTTVALWIKGGALNNTDCPVPECDTASVTFSGTIRPILATYCNGCHSGSIPQGGLDFTTYNGVKPSALSGSFYGSVLQGGSFSNMPKNGNRLPECQITQIKKWVELGSKND